ncbi:unnamed protein product [Rangifer tarandus platyrhynchus]|uniref:Uncharacterized protein n=1 Tax=Rangifer tarandus platyrhynchus TaxID=3082113 RepID=A0AC59YP08_RANTA
MWDHRGTLLTVEMPSLGPRALPCHLEFWTMAVCGQNQRRPQPQSWLDSPGYQKPRAAAHLPCEKGPPLQSQCTSALEAAADHSLLPTLAGAAESIFSLHCVCLESKDFCPTPHSHLSSLPEGA